MEFTQALHYHLAMPNHPPPYHAPPWLPGGHLQSIYPYFFAPRPAIAYRRERWETPDADFIDLDWLDASDSDAPLLVLFHGLESHSRSHYALSLMRELQHGQWRGVAPHFRGCSGESNRLPRAYHSGDSLEIDWILRRLRQQFPENSICAAGVSLGGNALLKWLGEQGGEALDVIDAAVAVSAPVDLPVAGKVLDTGFNQMTYTREFLHSLKRKALQKLAQHPDLFDANALRAATTLRQFDDIFTAPLHGFRDVDDYWTRASSKPWLPHIRVPTLLINARNDPFLPAFALPKQHEVAAQVALEYPATGGHVGFVSGPFPGQLDWLPRRILSFVESVAHPA